MAEGEPLPTEGDLLVPLDRWLAEERELRAHRGRIGLLIAGGEALTPILSALDRVLLIAVDFPRYTDGRGYTTARLLRGVHGYRGELRAVGDVRRDEVDLMRRCGFDTFEPAPGQSPEALAAAFGEIEPYPGQP